MPLISVLKPFIKTFEVNPNGSKRALVIGGVHGNEYTPIYSLMCLNKSLGELLNLEFPKLSQVFYEDLQTYV
jgi:succinylglutamate desuccinylase